MKREICAVALMVGLGFFGEVGAILSPLNQSAVEIKTIVEDKRLSELFGESEEIQKIVKTPHGYIVIGLKHKARVIVEYKRQNQPGPKPFDLLFLPPETK